LLHDLDRVILVEIAIADRDSLWIEHGGVASAFVECPRQGGLGYITHRAHGDLTNQEVADLAASCARSKRNRTGFGPTAVEFTRLRAVADLVLGHLREDGQVRRDSIYSPATVRGVRVDHLQHVR